MKPNIAIKDISLKKDISCCKESYEYVDKHWKFETLYKKKKKTIQEEKL